MSMHIFNTVSSSALTIYKGVANTGQRKTVVVKTTSVESTIVAFERWSHFSPCKVQWAFSMSKGVEKTQLLNET